MLALAGELKLNLCTHLGAGGGLQVRTQASLFRHYLLYPRKCIVVLLDIDCAGIIPGSNSNLQGFMYPYENSFEGPTEEPEEEVNTQSIEQQSDQQQGAGALKSSNRREEGLLVQRVISSSGDTTASKDKDKLTVSMTHSCMRFNSMQYPTNSVTASQIWFSGLHNAVDDVASHKGRNFRIMQVGRAVKGLQGDWHEVAGVGMGFTVHHKYTLCMVHQALASGAVHLR